MSRRFVGLVAVLVVLMRMVLVIVVCLLFVVVVDVNCFLSSGTTMVRRIQKRKRTTKRILILRGLLLF